jgi:hypothetical protein
MDKLGNIFSVQENPEDMLYPEIPAGEKILFLLVRYLQAQMRLHGFAPVEKLAVLKLPE